MAIPIWKQAGFNSQTDYEAELARKRSAGIALTRPDLAAEWDNRNNLLTAEALGAATGAATTGGATVAAKGPQLTNYKPKPFNAPKFQALSFAEALKMAQAQYAPQYQLARTNAGQVNQQQAGLLAQRLGARGQLNGGLRNEQELDLSQGFQRTLGDIDTGYNTLTATSANEMVQRREADNMQKLQMAYQQWQTAEQMRAQAIAQGNSNNIAVYNSQVAEAEREYNRAYQAAETEYNRSRDALSDTRYAEETAYGRSQDALQNSRENTRLALAIRDAQNNSGGTAGGDTVTPPVNLGDKKYAPYLAELKRMRAAYNEDVQGNKTPIYTDDQIKNYLLNLGLSDEETAMLLNYAGIAKPLTPYELGIPSGGRPY